jgi:prepilin-type N-terminal cleavage/methylation domain-containing protein
MKRRARGISLLEMLVALTILAISATLLFDWVYQVNTRMRKLNAEQVQTMAQTQAVQFLGLINPAATPTGTQAFASFTLEWQAQPTLPVRKVLDSGDGILQTELSVYAVHARLLLPGSSKTWLEFDTRLPGWTKLDTNPFANMGVP